MQNSAHLLLSRTFFSFSMHFSLKGAYLTCRICVLFILLWHPGASPEPKSCSCFVLSRNLVRCYTSIKQKHGLCGGMEGDTEMCELVFKNIICNGFYCRWDLHCLLSSRSVFFQLAKRRISCLSNLQYSWPPYISMLLKYQGTNDM